MPRRRGLLRHGVTVDAGHTVTLRPGCASGWRWWSRRTGAVVDAGQHDDGLGIERTSGSRDGNASRGDAGQHADQRADEAAEKHRAAHPAGRRRRNRARLSRVASTHQCPDREIRPLRGWLRSRTQPNAMVRTSIITLEPEWPRGRRFQQRPERTGKHRHADAEHRRGQDRFALDDEKAEQKQRHGRQNRAARRAIPPP